MENSTSEQLRPSDRVLRIICILAFFPGLAFLLASGIPGWRSHDWAFVGIAPLTLSALLGLLVLFIGSKHAVIVILADLVLAFFTLAMDIWGWIDGSSNGMMGGHATSVLLIEFIIHSFFVLRAIYVRIGVHKLVRLCNPFRSSGSCSRCPHCLSEARARKVSVRAVGDKKSYHRVPGREEEYGEEEDAVPVAYQDARPSTDNESARLV